MFFRNLLATGIPLILSTFLSFLLNNYNLLVSQNWLYGLAFLVLMTFILNLVYAFRAGSVNYTQLLLVSSVIKLLLALIVIVIYSFFDERGFFNFSIHFISHYVLFTIFEIRYLLYIIKKHPPKHN